MKKIDSKNITDYTLISVEKWWLNKVRAVAKKRGESVYQYLRAVEEKITQGK